MLDTAEAVELYARLPVEALRDIALPLSGPGLSGSGPSRGAPSRGHRAGLLDAPPYAETVKRWPGTLEALRVALLAITIPSVEGLPGYFAALPLQETEEIFWEQAV